MDQFTAHLDRGWDLVSRGDFAGALISAQKGMELDGESPEVHNLLGFILAAEGNAEDALTHYKQAVELDDTFVEAMLNAAEVLIHPLGDYPGALTFIDDALELMEDDDELTDAMVLKIDALLATGDLEAAETTARRLPTGPFEQPGLSFLVGRAKIEVGDVEGGAPHVVAAAEQEPDNAEVQYYLGVVLEFRGDHHGATLAFLRCRALDASLPSASWSLPVEQFEREVERALARLDSESRQLLDGALVVVVGAPGAEVVADGVDPRVDVLLDLASDGEETKVVRIFVYQQNVERAAGGIYEIEDALVEAFSREIVALKMGVDELRTV
jgi:Flp pilus assembly protein TadD